jgi:hypothetical protein
MEQDARWLETARSYSRLDPAARAEYWGRLSAEQQQALRAALAQVGNQGAPVVSAKRRPLGALLVLGAAATVLLLVGVVQNWRGRREQKAWRPPTAYGAAHSSAPLPGEAPLTADDLQRMVAFQRVFTLAGAELIDVVSGRPVRAGWPDETGSPVLGRKDSVLLGCPSCMDRHRLAVNGSDRNLPPPRVESATGFVYSRDARQLVYARNGDLWLADLDWNLNKAKEGRRLTTTGVFNDTRGGWWSGDSLVVGEYRVSLRDGHVSEPTIGWFRIEDRRSPDGRTVLRESASRELRAYDLRTDSWSDLLLDGVNARSFLWLDDDRAVINNWNNELLEFDRRRGSVVRVIAKLDWYDELFAPSPDGRFFMATDGKGDHRLLLIDSRSWAVTPLTAGMRDVVWADAGAFFFARDEPIEMRGTWRYAVAAGAEQKVSPYPSKQLVVLPAAGYAVFLANSNLWRVDVDGSDLKQLTTSDKEDGTLVAAVEAPARGGA